MSHIIRSKRHSFEKKKKRTISDTKSSSNWIKTHKQQKPYKKSIQEFKKNKTNNNTFSVITCKLNIKKLYNINSTTVNNNYNMNKNNRLNLSARNHELVEYHAITKPHCMYVSKVTEILEISFWLRLSQFFTF